MAGKVLKSIHISQEKKEVKSYDMIHIFCLLVTKAKFQTTIILLWIWGK